MKRSEAIDIIRTQLTQFARVLEHRPDITETHINNFSGGLLDVIEIVVGMRPPPHWVTEGKEFPPDGIPVIKVAWEPET